jgi:phenylacetyl-CoA:acceptor oxidoreductase 27-kDa subunit
MRFGMVIDTRKCIGCKACVVVCKQSNEVPMESWRRVVDCGVGGPPGRLRVFFPMSCMHCSEPPCREVCPTGATHRRPDGIVEINNRLCVGCGYCIVACPYQARKIVFRDAEEFESKKIEHELGTHDGEEDRIGVSTKCNFCLGRVEQGVANGRRPGIDPEATPLCVVSCSAEALRFGDLEDPESEISRLIEGNKTICLQPELGTSPSVYYIVE